VTNVIEVRYWAAAKSAAGTPSDRFEVDGPLTLAEVVRRAAALHAEVLKVCSALIGDRPAGTGDPGGIEVPPGSTVEFLPPFAGG
jgi:molybdopterin synthase sulfur carrier subunit